MSAINNQVLSGVTRKLGDEPARFSFVQVFEPKRVNTQDDKSKPRYSLNLLLDKKIHAGTIARLQRQIKDLSLSVFKFELEADRICLKDGTKMRKPDGSFVEGYGPGVVYISLASPGDKPPPAVVDGNLTPLKATDGKPYSGCYGYATFNFWAQGGPGSKCPPSWGKRVNGGLINVQFIRNGEPFGGGGIPTADGLTPEPEEGDSNPVG